MTHDGPEPFDEQHRQRHRHQAHSRCGAAAVEPDPHPVRETSGPAPGTALDHPTTRPPEGEL